MHNKNFSYFRNIYADDDLRKRILDSTINKKEPIFKLKERRIPKLAFVFIIIFMVAILGIGVVVANEYVEEYILKRQAVNHDDEYLLTLLYPVKTTGKADLTCRDSLTLEDVEENLGITLLGHNEDFNIVFDNYCDINNNEDGKTMSVSLSSSNSYDFHYDKDNLYNKRIDIDIMFYTEYADSESKNKFVDYELMAADNTTLTVKKRHLNSLDVDVYLMKFEIDYYAASFVYNNVTYVFFLYQFNANQSMEFLETLK